ncbi:MAG: 4,5-dihydroxyphthalate decarboxylase [Actinobacteria bacterium]|nr:4,5-dihydroxyphthalate decarboxylase [Actinomycetota bacterium]
MSDLNLKVGFWKYDHVRALFDGQVTIDGVAAEFESAGIISETFESMVRDQAFDVSELGLTFYLRTLAAEDPPFVAIPVFPNRHFRHSAIWVNTESGIKEPKDLVGKTIGEFFTYGHDAGIWPKGILADDFGVTPEQSKWVIGGTDWWMPPCDFIPFIQPDGVEIETTPRGKELGPMLDSGEIDALISAVVPKCVTEGSPRVAQLFPDYQAVERDYYRRTGLYPIMHTVVVKRELLAANPGLGSKLLDAFSRSRDIALAEYERGRMEHQMSVMPPWFNRLYEENRQCLDDDWWPYGVDANRKNIDTFLRYSHEQGLTPRRLTCEDIFAEELLDT